MHILSSDNMLRLTSTSDADESVLRSPPYRP